MNLFQSVSSLKQGLAQVLFGLMLLAGSSVLLHLLDGQRTAVARAEQLAYLPKGDLSLIHISEPTRPY